MPDHYDEKLSLCCNGSRLSLSHKLKSAVYVLSSVLAFRPHKNGFWTHQNAGGFQKRSSEYIVQSRDFGKRRLLVYVWTDEKLSDPEIRGAQSQKKNCFRSKNKGGGGPPGPLPWICHCRGFAPCVQNGTPESANFHPAEKWSVAVWA